MSEELKKEDLVMKEEDKDNFKDSVIQRVNLTNEFTVGDIEKHVATLKKTLAEIDATLKVAVASKENVERNHSKVLDELDEEAKKLAWVWQDQENIIAEMTPKKENFDEEIAKHETYLEMIYDKFGFVKTEVDA